MSLSDRGVTTRKLFVTVYYMWLYASSKGGCESWWKVMERQEFWLQTTIVPVECWSCPLVTQELRSWLVFLSKQVQWVNGIPVSPNLPCGWRISHACFLVRIDSLFQWHDHSVVTKGRLYNAFEWIPLTNVAYSSKGMHCFLHVHFFRKPWPRRLPLSLWTICPFLAHFSVSFTSFPLHSIAVYLLLLPPARILTL